MARKTKRLERAEEAADRQPVARHADPVVVVRGAQDPGDEREADDHVEPLLQHLAVDAGQADEQEGQERALDHLPDALDPEVHRPPAVEDAHRVVVELEQRRQVEQRGACESADQHALGGREAAAGADRHAEVVEEHQHHDHDDDLQREGLLEQLVAGRPPEDVADDGGHAHGRPDRELDVREADAVELHPRLLGHQIVGGAHEAGQQPDEEQIRVDGLDDVERQDVQQRIGPQVLGGGEQAEDHLQAEEEEGDDEVRIGDALRADTSWPSSHWSVSR